MDNYEIIDDIKGEALALLKQAERLSSDLPDQLAHLQPIIQALEYVPSAFGDGRIVLYDLIPED